MLMAGEDSSTKVIKQQRN